MKLDRKKMLLISFMLFSLFFGAGNLIFPPFLGQNAGSSTVSAMLGFLATAVILPVLGVIVVARFDGLEQLAQHAGKKFSLIFTVLIYLSIGPGLGIPRAASVPFEMAVAPYLPQDANIRVLDGGVFAGVLPGCTVAVHDAGQARQPHWKFSHAVAADSARVSLHQLSVPRAGQHCRAADGIQRLSLIHI